MDGKYFMIIQVDQVIEIGFQNSTQPFLCSLQSQELFLFNLHQIGWYLIVPEINTDMVEIIMNQVNAVGGVSAREFHIQAISFGLAYHIYDILRIS